MSAIPSQNAPRTTELLRALRPRDLAAIAEEIKKKSETLAEGANATASRKFRSLRASEVAELTGLSETRIRAWRNEHKEELDAFKTHSNDSAIIQLPLTLEEVHRLQDDSGVRPHRPKGARAVRLGVFNFKGGSTKTSTTLHLATYLAMKGWRVLAIDADPQGSLTSLFSIDQTQVDDDNTLWPAFAVLDKDYEGVPPQLSPLATHVDGLDIIPATLSLIESDFAVSAAFRDKNPRAKAFYNIIADAIATVEDDYDIILVDGAPAFSFTATAVMWAMDGMIVPVPPASPDFKATAAFCAMSATAMDGLCRTAGRPERQWAPVTFVHNRVKARQSSDTVMGLSREVFGRYLCSETIADTAAVPAALLMSKSVFEGTSTDLDSKSLRTARANYSAFGRSVERDLADLWASGGAAEGTQP